MAIQSIADKMTPSEAVSYAGAGASLASAFTLTEIGVIVGIITALLTYVTNLYFSKKKERRETRESELRARESELRIYESELRLKLIKEDLNVPQ